MWLYILLGILQGIFEWLPISSEGIVALASLPQEINPIDIALFLHLGTFFAVLIYFRKDWGNVLIGKDKKLLKFLIIATIISLAVGLPLYLSVRNTAALGGSILLLLTGFGLLATSYFHKTKRKFGFAMNKLAMVTGLLQGLAVIPGLSRSGATIFGLSFGKLKPIEILKYSYMMSAPIVLVSTVYISLTNTIIFQAWPALITSFIIGLLSLHVLIKLSKKINFFKFTLMFGILCLVGGSISLFI
ncbi:hypothetical protein GF374_01560 [Candidatus Woesearchaeota archaeon]|nr:hypothetical protein [Candidatus Woesearchaeota archaeon]